MLMTKMQDIQKKSDAVLVDMIKTARETVRQERFKDKFSRKANIIKTAKTEIARSLTELTARRRNQKTK